MKKSRFTESQILAILKQGESGVPVSDLCRELGISNATFYNWRSKYGGMDASLMAEMKAMAEENRRLKKMYAEIADWLVRLTTTHRTWGFGLCFLYLRNVKGFA
ncbi:MAG: transposase, partial [Roseibium sp.]|uniref:transposase n=1 Tax=Roseibium sp. TaxID=1936156 RepID=UPI003299D9EA